MALIEEKKIIIRLSDIITAIKIKDQLREKIVKRIIKGVDSTPVNRQVVIIRKLPSEDLAVYVNNLVTKKKIKFIVK
jgi:hypothetical protein